MHGILFKQLKTYVSDRWDDDVWTESMDEAGIEPKLYLPVTDYPDDEAMRLIDAVTTVTGVDRRELLDDFGESLAPALLDTFKAHVKDDWGAMDLLEHSGNEVFEVLRSENAVDEVTAERTAEDTVVVEYGSSLELCTMAKAIVRGLADEHGESVDVTERACAKQGADACEIRVTRT